MKKILIPLFIGVLLATTSFADSQSIAAYDYWFKQKFQEGSCNSEELTKLRMKYADYFGSICSENAIASLWKGMTAAIAGNRRMMQIICSKECKSAVLNSSKFNKACFDNLDDLFLKISDKKESALIRDTYAKAGCKLKPETYCKFTAGFNAQGVATSEDLAATKCQSRISCSEPVIFDFGNNEKFEFGGGTADFVCRGRVGSCEDLSFSNCPVIGGDRIRNAMPSSSGQSMGGQATSQGESVK